MANPATLRSIVSEIRTFCKSHEDKKQVARYARFFTEGYDAYGVDKDVLMAKRSELIENYREKLSLDDVIKLGELLIQSGKYEEASFAILIAEAYQGEFNKKSFQKFGGWLEKGIRNWGHTDVFCGIVLSTFLEKEVVEMNAMAAWRKSSSKWKRRAVPVAMIPLAKTVKNLKPLLQFIEPQMLDEDRFVQQGLGWFLREAWKKQRKPVESFLLKWKDSAPRKIYQYGTEKMTKKEKERFRRER